MRSALALLGCLLSTTARADLVQAELTGHITSLAGGNGQPVSSAFTASSLGLPIGEPVQAHLSYFVDPSPTQKLSGYGLSLTAGQMQFTPHGFLDAEAAPLHPTAPPGYGGPGRAPGMYVMNGLQLTPSSQLTYIGVSLTAPDPHGQLLGTAVAPGLYVSMPGSAALAAYSPQANGAYIDLQFQVGNSSYSANIAVDSITVDPSIANHAPEPSSLLLFGLGGLGLLGLVPRRTIGSLRRAAVHLRRPGHGRAAESMGRYGV